MTPKEKFRKLAELLYKKTISHELDWSEADWSGGAKTAIGDRYVQLTQQNSQDGEPLEILEILASNGTQIDSFNDELFRGERPSEYPQFSGYYEMMSSTREMAERQATGADNAIDEILDALENPF